MKRFHFFLFMPVVLLLPTAVFSQVQALRTEFTYDGAGNRIKRQVNLGIVSPKPSQGDTVIQEFGLGSIAENTIKIKAYPNPVTSTLVIENQNWSAENKVNVKLYDITGKLIREKMYGSAIGKLSFTGLASGTYNVHYYLDNKLLTQWKIVKAN